MNGDCTHNIDTLVPGDTNLGRLATQINSNDRHFVWWCLVGERWDVFEKKIWLQSQGFAGPADT